MSGKRTIRVLVWNENVSEKERPRAMKAYPNGIHDCLKALFSEEQDMTVTTRTLADEKQGISEELLDNTDVLVWWSHVRHHEITEETVECIVRHVQSGMGLIALHSSHCSKIMQRLLGTTMTLAWHEDDSETLWCVNPTHPIAASIPEHFAIPEEEKYCEYFDIPKPDDLIFIGSFASGGAFRSGCTFTRGLGKIFYFQPGHEEAPVYEQKEIRQILKNAVRWSAPSVKRCLPENRMV